MQAWRRLVNMGEGHDQLGCRMLPQKLRDGRSRGRRDVRAALRKPLHEAAHMSESRLVVDAAFEARVKRDEPMSRHTSWHVGGPADVYFSPRDRADLLAFLATLPGGTPLFWLGLGSNLLVRDGGIRGVVIDTQAGLTRLERINDTMLTCEAGVPCARLARQCIKWGLGPAEFLAGIPGTLGGALAMNAGAFGGETWPRVRSVDVCDARGNARRRDAREYQYGYRHIVAPAPGEFFWPPHLSSSRVRHHR